MLVIVYAKGHYARQHNAKGEKYGSDKNTTAPEAPLIHSNNTPKSDTLFHPV
jgi:hypothetical protein